MLRRIERSVVLVLCLACAPGCSRPQAPARQAATVGSHHVQFLLPAGWEHLDHGRQHLFRHGEAQLLMRDLGEADRDSALLALTGDPQRREIASRDTLEVGGSGWIVLKTWDRVSHMNPSSIAGVVQDGRLLVLATGLGSHEQTGPAFEGLLQSLRVSADSSEGR